MANEDMIKSGVGGGLKKSEAAGLACQPKSRSIKTTVEELRAIILRSR
jgi:hypothetical protein